MELHIQKQYFDKILSGEKIYEGRLAKDKYRLLKIGDNIKFKTDGTKKIIEKQIKSVHIFGSFAEAGKKLGIEKILPGCSNEEIVITYKKFYSESDEKKYNVVMIEI